MAVTETKCPYPTRLSVRRAHLGRRRLQFQRSLGAILVVGAVVIGVLLAREYWWSEIQAGKAMAANVQAFRTQHGPMVAQVEPTRRFDAPPEIDKPPYGQTFAVLHVPTWNQMQIPVGEGTDDYILDQGFAGHHIDTALPGEVGNFALAGHRLTHGSNFLLIDELEAGASVIVETDTAYLFYQVTSHDVVDPSAVEILAPVPALVGAEPTARMLTMYSCHPRNSNSSRWVVYAELVFWTEKIQGAPSAVIPDPGGEG